jgi:hypothetical protein
MDVDEDGVTRAVAEQSRMAAEMLERSLLGAVGRVETELARVVRTGEADLGRLAGLVVEIVAKLATTNVAGGVGAGAGEENAAGSLNDVATAIARAVRRGARFS